MKKILFSLFAMASFAGANAQVQRMVFVEEFTNASCGPCASQNPSFNALLEQNTTKVIPLKYQTVWPGTDPMNAANTTDVATRVTYYSVTGVPWGVMDGDTNKMPTTASAYGGAPAALTQAQINTEYAIPSPLTMNLTHAFNATADSFIVNLSITASQAVSGTLKLRLALREGLIKFNTAPGSNGEIKFENVMRKMYPDADGTSLSNLSLGQTVNYSWTLPIPAYVYLKTQLGFVAWVQDDATKVVHQAAVSLPQYASDLSIAGITSISCVNTANPSVTIKNEGSVALTSCVINYNLDGGANQTQNWTGNLAIGATTTVNLPALSGLANGSHKLNSYLSSPNGVASLSNQSSMSSKSFITYPTSGSAPVAENFSSATFPPTGFGTVATSGTSIWIKASASQSGSAGSAEAPFFDISEGVLDLYLPKTDLNLTGQTSAAIDFNLAYTYYTASGNSLYDTLQVLASKDCGATWQNMWELSGAAMSTAPASSSAFTPTSSQWWGYSVSLNSLVGQPNVLVKFTGKSGFGNNLYIDNINLRYGVVNSVASTLSEANVQVYPNPAKNDIVVSMNFNEMTDATLTLVDMTGKTIFTKDLGKTNNFSEKINVSNLAKGLYQVNIKTSNGIVSKKISIQ